MGRASSPEHWRRFHDSHWGLGVDMLPACTKSIEVRPMIQDVRILLTGLALLLAWLAFIDRPNGRTLALAISASLPFAR